MYSLLDGVLFYGFAASSIYFYVLEAGVWECIFREVLGAVSSVLADPRMSCIRKCIFRSYNIHFIILDRQ
jgi:hypothetical protein